MLINAISTNEDKSFNTVFNQMFGKDTTMADLNRAIPDGKKLVSRPEIRCDMCGNTEVREYPIPQNSICADGVCTLCDECGHSWDYR